MALSFLFSCRFGICNIVDLGSAKRSEIHISTGRNMCIIPNLLFLVGQMGKYRAVRFFLHKSRNRPFTSMKNDVILHSKNKSNQYRTSSIEKLSMQKYDAYQRKEVHVLCRCKAVNLLCSINVDVYFTHSFYRRERAEYCYRNYLNYSNDSQNKFSKHLFLLYMYAACDDITCPDIIFFFYYLLSTK